MQLSHNSTKHFHPLWESVSELVRKRRSELPDLRPLDFDPELKNIYRKSDDNDLFIINELHSARGFRKLHLEIAKLIYDLTIFHCVFFPDPCFDLPIFGVDLVASSQGISAAIVDLSPVDKSLPINFLKELEKISIPPFREFRELPNWGTIFSPNVCFIRPVNESEEKMFLKVVDKYLSTLISLSITTTPDSPLSPLTIERHKNQKFYCKQQKLNDKTRKVLAQTFDENWADRYIDLILFDSTVLL